MSNATLIRDAVSSVEGLKNKLNNEKTQLA